MRRRSLLLVGIGSVADLTLPACVGSRAPAPSNSASKDLADIDKLTGADREKALYKGAKKEGSVTWYTGLIPKQLVEPMKKVFEQKYSGVKLDYYRAGSSEIATKILTEARARSPQSDVWDGAHASEALKAARAAEKYSFPTATDFPDDIKDPDGYWTAANIYIKGIAFNTKQVKPAEAPRTLDDLLDPRWHGKMAWTPEATGGADFIGNVLHSLGEDKGTAYLDRLAKQDIAVVKVSSRQLLNMAIAGQYPIVIQVFNNHVAISRKDGASVEWRALDAASKELNPMGLTAGSKRPYAGRLLIDFILSEEGQHVFRDANYIPARPGVDPADPSLSPKSGGFKVNLLSPHLIEKESKHWVEIFKKLNGR